MKQEIRQLSIEEIRKALLPTGEPAYRAGQIFSWLHEKQAASFAGMSDLPRTLRAYLEDTFALTTLVPVVTQRSSIDNTAKYLMRLGDGLLIESVAMHYRFGLSVCISSQAGCGMGCSFCASAIGGVSRSLTAAEMLEQIYAIGRSGEGKVGRVVVMGSGEPFHNYGELLTMIRLLTCKEGMDLSSRHITVSTCGIVPRIRDFAVDCPQVNLAVSLHAPTQAKRERIMPVASAFPLAELIDACRDYEEKTRRRLTFEYILIRGENDSAQDALDLAALLKGINCVVNLIPVNPVTEKDIQAPTKTHVRDFKINLENSGINVTIRREMGRDIDGACGQLRHREAMR